MQENSIFYHINEIFYEHFLGVMDSCNQGTSGASNGRLCGGKFNTVATKTTDLSSVCGK